MISSLERGLILRALQKMEENQLKKALFLGINRITIRGKMERYHIKKEVWGSGTVAAVKLPVLLHGASSHLWRNPPKHIHLR
jgi:hypothetical protein